MTAAGHENEKRIALLLYNSSNTAAQREEAVVAR